MIKSIASITILEFLIILKLLYCKIRASLAYVTTNNLRILFTYIEFLIRMLK